MDLPLLLLLAVFTPIVGAGVLPLVAAGSRRWVAPAALLAGAASAALALALLFELREAPVRASAWLPSLGLALDLRADALSGTVAAIAGVLGAAVLVYSTAYMPRATAGAYSLTRYYALVLLFTGAMVGLALADNLLAFFVFWETVGLCSFLLIAYYHRDAKARRAGLKALVVTQAGGAGLLLAVVALWSQDGITTFSGLLASGGAASALPLAAFGMLAAALAKSAQFPFHVWLPDAMEAPTPVSALIHAATMVNAGVYLVARTLPSFAPVPGYLEAVMWLGVASALVGALGALKERDLKRVLAYSTVSQLGLMFAALGAGALLAASFHLFAQALFKALLFLAAGAAIQAAATRDLGAMGGLRKGMPFTSAAFLLGVLAMAGVPPFVGFWSKDLVLESVLATSLVAFLLLAAVSLATAAYGVRAWWLAFGGRPRGVERASEAPLPMLVPVLALAGAAAIGGALLGPVAQAFAATMPGSALHALSPPEALAAGLALPVAAVTLGAAAVAAFGLAIHRARFEREAPARSPWRRLVASGFLVGALFDALAEGALALGGSLRRLETADTTLNMAAVLGVLALIAAALSGGAL